MKRLFDIQNSSKAAGGGSFGGQNSSQMLTEDQKKMIAMNMQKNDMKSFLGMIQGGEGQLNEDSINFSNLDSSINPSMYNESQTTQ